MYMNVIVGAASILVEDTQYSKCGTVLRRGRCNATLKRRISVVGRLADVSPHKSKS